jgi:copper homeostasis protein CutC
MPRVTLEVVCCSAEDCIKATRAGASRIELCSAIELGGLTPTMGLFQRCRNATELPIIVMIRPRSGGFVYSQEEQEVMISDIVHFAEASADGFVTGCLNPEGGVADQFCRRAVACAAGLPITFHRAFDALLGDPLEAAHQLKTIGFKRILTSGGLMSAAQGVSRLGRLVRETGLEIIAGGGVRAENVLQILSSTGCSAIHMGPFVPSPEPGYQGVKAMHLDHAAVASVSNLLA